jgi:hypothetical protein
VEAEGREVDWRGVKGMEVGGMGRGGLEGGVGEMEEAEGTTSIANGCGTAAAAGNPG